MAEYVPTPLKHKRKEQTNSNKEHKKIKATTPCSITVIRVAKGWHHSKHKAFWVLRYKASLHTACVLMHDSDCTKNNALTHF